MAEQDNGNKIEFILRMQAQFEANLGKIEANLGRLEANVARLETNVAQLTANMLRGESNIDKLRDSQGTLTAAMVRMTEIMQESQQQADARFNRLDERLNTLITVVERHITGPGHAPQA
jgi:exonuclease VII small subunit